MRGLIIGGAMALALAGCGAAAKAARGPGPEPWCTAEVAGRTEQAQGVSGPLAALSDRFREAHQRARAEACRQLGSQRLVIRYGFGTIEARWNGRDLGPPVSLFTPHVHALKAVSHAVFLAALLFDEPVGSARDRHVVASVSDLEALRRELADPSTGAARLFPPAELPRQLEILTLTATAVRAVRDGRWSESARRDYFAATRPLLDANLRSASAAVLALLHQTVEGYRRQVEAKAWGRLVVVAAVAHQARAREIAVQYFERRLGEAAAEGASGEDRLVVIESRFDPGEQRGALAAHEVDRRYAGVIFGEPDRLQSDVLADSGGLLDELLPPPARQPGSARR
jgi:hypothetical protein